VILNILIWAALAIGLFFNTLGVIGILRFPDVYTRLHADTKATTFGSIFTSLAVVLYGAVRYFQTLDGQYAALALHTVIAVVVLAITNATAAHAIARAAYRRGHRPAQAVVDRLEGHQP
jgi:multicomponent Na+:H+ antiporter subunit G